jgi:butyryl-CoA dehydrogenase
MRANPVSSIFLENCRVPAKNMLGLAGEGVKIGMESLNVGRLGIAAQALGIAQAAFDSSILYSKDRHQFQKPLSSFHTIRNYLADMATDIDAGRLILYRACASNDSGDNFCKEAAMAKLFCSEMAMRVTDKAVQIHGGYGYSKEYDVERYFRDAKVTEIYEGTSEIQRMIISREILAKRV